MKVREFAAAALAQEIANPLRVLYLDIDGTVRKGFDELGRFVNCAADVEIFPEALSAIKEYKKEGWLIVGVTNQGGIALGHQTMQDAIDALWKTHVLCGGLFDKICMCRHHPQATDPLMSSCWCRKPKIGMLIEAAQALAERHQGMCPPSLALMVGDRLEDEQCAANAGVRFLWAKDWRAGAR